MNDDRVIFGAVCVLIALSIAFEEAGYFIASWVWLRGRFKTLRKSCVLAEGHDGPHSFTVKTEGSTS